MTTTRTKEHPDPAAPPEVRELIQAGRLRHVAIIMDGNRRWASDRHLLKAAGHGEGVKALKRIVETAGSLKLEALTVYAFSTENWNRDQREVETLMNLFVQTIHKEVDNLHQNQVCLKFIGDLSAFSDKLKTQIEQAMEKTAANTGLCLQVAINYGSRHELVEAVRQISADVKAGKLEPASIDEATIQSHLYTRDCPDPDLLIRTGGECRLSNYLLWQAAYAELYITDTLWPDFTPEAFVDAMTEFSQRQRRYGQ